MSKCDLQIVVDRADRVFKPNDKVTGKVVARLTDQVRCDALTILLQWKTHGKGNTDHGPETEKLNLGTFEWMPGVYEYPFELEIATGPVSYHGSYINVDWYLSARADVPWAFDPKGEIDVILEPAPPQLVAGEGYRAPRKLEPVKHQLGLPKTKPPQLPLGCAIFLVLGFLGMMYFGFADAIANGEFMPVAIFGSIVALIIGGIVVSRTMAAMARSALGDFSIEVMPQETLAGNDVRVSFRIAPEKRLELLGLNLKLVGEEVAVSGSGTNKTTHRHVLHTHELSVCKERAIKPGEVLEESATIKVPETAAPSFHGDDNNVRWTIHANIDIPKWPDFNDKFEIDVQPS